MTDHDPDELARRTGAGAADPCDPHAPPPAHAPEVGPGPGERRTPSGHADLEAILEAMPLALLVLGETLTVEAANRAFRDSFQLGDAPLQGRSIYALDDGQWDTPALRRLLEDPPSERHPGEGVRVELAFAQVGTRNLHLRTARLGSLRKTLLAVEDVTEYERSRAAQRHAEGERDRFLAQLGHELRNPLAVVSNTVAALLMADLPPADVRKALERIQRQVRRQVRLVDDLLNIGRISQGRLEVDLRPVDLSDTIRDALEQAQPRAEARGLRLELDLPAGPLPVTGDDGRLAQILTNLLCNAVQYSDSGQTVTLSAELAGERVLVRVRDRGIGIAAEDLTKLFRPFSRLPGARDRYAEGMGLGLSLSRQLAELHGGRLEVHSEGPGRGSEFRLSLPRRQQPGEAQRPPTGATMPAGLPRRRILLVEDDPAAGAAMRMLLEQLGQQVRHAATGHEALEAAADFAPDLVILDLHLPDIPGQEVASRLRQRHGPQTPALVALSGYAPEDTEPSSAGRPPALFDRHFIKPARLEDLESLLLPDGRN